MTNNIKQFFIKRKLFFIGLIISLFLMIIDLYSKYFIFDFLDNLILDGVIFYPSFKVTGFFNLVQVWNNGVSFGMFSQFASAKIFIILLNIIIISF